MNTPVMAGVSYFVITYLKFLRVVHSRDGLHQMGSRVVTKVRADITDTETSTTGLQILWMLKSRFVQCIYLWKTQWYKNTNTAGEQILV